MAEEDSLVAAGGKDPDVVIPRIRLGEVGYIGLKKSAGRILEESQSAFRYPRFISTVAEMRNNPTVGAATNVYRMLMGRPEWSAKAPKGASDKAVARAKIVGTMMHDMTHSWSDFIQSTFPYLEYGFSLNEIVLRRRLYANGSKYNDGLVGIHKLPPRSPTTIEKWVYAEGGNDLVAVQQTLAYCDPEDKKFFSGRYATGKIEIPMSKLLHFVASPTNGNPEGNSIYKNIYLAYKQLELLTDQELIGIAKDVQGMLKIGLPPRYFSDSASDNEKATLAMFQKIIDNYNAGKQRGLLVPMMPDTDTKLPLFTYELLEKKGSATYDVEKIIKRLQSDILSALSVDILKLGSDGAGSFALADSKTSVLTLANDYRLREIKNVLNTKLMPTIYEMNGWDKSEMAEFDYADIEDVSLEEFSKAIQRIFSTNAIEFDRAVANKIREVLKVQLKSEEEDVDKEELPGNMAKMSSRSGDGMAVGTTGDGTSTSPGGGDRSTNNMK